MANNRKHYDDDFKKMIVDLFKNGRSADELAKEFGIYRGAVYRWKKEFEIIHKDDGQALTNRDMTEMKRKMAKMEKENAILKDALRIMSKK